MKAADEDIISKVLNGDREAYAVLVERYKDRVFGLALRMVRNRELAEEVAQDAFVKAYRSLNKFRKEAGFSTWIYRITYNTAISELRKQKNLPGTAELVDDKTSLPENGEEQETAEQKERRHVLVEKALGDLGPEEQLLVMLYYYEEHSIEQISGITGLSVSNVKVKLYRIRQKLKEIIQKTEKQEQRT